MSKYTTEVRYICEEAAGLRESKGYEDVNEIVAAACPKIFDPTLTFYNDETRDRLLPKILVHYYTREIGFETVGLWKLKLNQKLREILPYYNQLYASEDLEYDPLKNVDNTHTHDGSYVDNKKAFDKKNSFGTETRDLRTVDDGSASYDRNEDTILRHSKTTARGNDTTAKTINAARDHWVMYSDTPQGGIDGVSAAGGVGSSGTLSGNAYLTNATHETEAPAATTDTTTHGNIVETYNLGAANTADHVDQDGWDKTDNVNTHTGTIQNANETTDDNTRKDDGTDTYTKHEIGKIGVETYQEMVMKYRDTFLNIDMQVIEELSDLFMKVW